MGYTGFSHETLMRHINPHEPKRMLTIGDQIVYFNPEYGTYMKPYYEKHYPHIEHVVIDIAPEKFAKQHDFRTPLDEGLFDVVTDYGSSEHFTPDEEKGFHGLYEAHKHSYECCKVGGILHHENPETESWKGHGMYYKTELFYTQYAEDMGLQILEVGRHGAMGNVTDGWNIYCVLKKLDEREFVDLKTFKAYAFLTE